MVTESMATDGREISTRTEPATKAEPELKRNIKNQQKEISIRIEPAPEAEHKEKTSSKNLKINRTKKIIMNQEQISRTKWDPGKKKCQKEEKTTKENETEKRITTTEIATICIAWVPIL